MTPSSTDIADERNKASDATISGVSRFPSMTYEEGVEAALAWMIGEVEERPMDD